MAIIEQNKTIRNGKISLGICKLIEISGEKKRAKYCQKKSTSQLETYRFLINRENIYTFPLHLLCMQWAIAQHTFRDLVIVSNHWRMIRPHRCASTIHIKCEHAKTHTHSLTAAGWESQIFEWHFLILARQLTWLCSFLASFGCWSCDGTPIVLRSIYMNRSAKQFDCYRSFRWFCTDISSQLRI